MTGRLPKLSSKGRESAAWGPAGTLSSQAPSCSAFLQGELLRGHRGLRRRQGVARPTYGLHSDTGAEGPRTASLLLLGLPSTPLLPPSPSKRAFSASQCMRPVSRQ